MFLLLEEEVEELVVEDVLVDEKVVVEPITQLVMFDADLLDLLEVSLFCVDFAFFCDVLGGVFGSVGRGLGVSLWSVCGVDFRSVVDGLNGSSLNRLRFSFASYFFVKAGDNDFSSSSVMSITQFEVVLIILFGFTVYS